MLSKLIWTEKNESFFLKRASMGSFLMPPGHANEKWSISFKGGSASIDGAIKADWMPQQVKDLCQHLIDMNPGDFLDKEWIKSVYLYMRHCYEVDGKSLTFGKFWDNSGLECEMNPENHLACIYVRKFNPSHQPRTDLF